MKKELIQNGLTGKTDHILTLQPVPEKMHQVSLRPIITHLLNLPEPYDTVILIEDVRFIDGKLKILAKPETKGQFKRSITRTHEAV